MTKPWTFWEAEEKPFQAHIWVTRNFRIKTFQLFSYQKRCVCTSTSMKCFHSDFQRDILFVLILHFLLYDKVCTRGLTGSSSLLLSTAWGPPLVARVAQGHLPQSRESGEMVKSTCWLWKLWNCTKSEILKRYQDSASRLTPKIDFHFQLWGYFCCLHFYFQLQHSSIYHKTHFYKPSPSRQPLLL